jgi:CheY-like chemotaxis protein
MDHPLRIVVADDERDTREYLQEYLAHLGYDVRAAGDGRELVRLCREFAPDLVVTDYAMPGPDGWAAAKEVNRDRCVPVILFSGRHDGESLSVGEKSPVTRVLIKPMKEAELRGAIEEVFAQTDERVVEGPG